MLETLPAPEVRPLLLDLAGVAAALQVSTRQLRRLILSGHFGPAIIHLGKRAVRISGDELRAWTGAGCPPRSKWRWTPEGGCRCAAK